MRTRGPQRLVSLIHPLPRPRRHWHARGPGCRLTAGVLKPPINLPRGVRQGVLGADGADLGLGKRRLEGQVGAENFFRVLRKTQVWSRDALGRHERLPGSLVAVVMAVSAVQESQYVALCYSTHAPGLYTKKVAPLPRSTVRLVPLIRKPPVHLLRRARQGQVVA